MIKRRGQEEMVGFALIIILVAVILIIFLGIYLSKEKKVETESYEVESFLSTALQYTSDCKSSIELLSVQKLMFACYENQICSDGRTTCSVLEKEVSNILEEAWPIGNSPVKGYEFNIKVDNQTLIPSIKEGNVSSNLKGTASFFSRSNLEYSISVKIYY